MEVGKIVKDKRYTNTLWCLCNNYEEYLQFAKDLFLLKGKYYYEKYDKNARWITDGYEWSGIFDVELKNWEDDDIYYEESVNPINDTYEIKERPKDSEYPVVIHYDDYHKNVLWMSLNKLNKE